MIKLKTHPKIIPDIILDHFSVFKISINQLFGRDGVDFNVVVFVE
jgi:hypothetical protein